MRKEGLRNFLMLCKVSFYSIAVEALSENLWKFFNPLKIMLDIALKV